MKKILFTTFFLSLLLFANAQNYLGVHSSLYAGLYGLDTNPAMIVQDNIKFELNVLSSNLDVNTTNVFFDKNNLTSLPSVKWFDFSSTAPIKIQVASNTNVLSFAFNSGKKSSFAFTINHKVYSDIQGLSGQFMDAFVNDFDNLQDLPILFENEPSNSTVLGWTETGLTYGRTVFAKHRHAVKVAMRVKMLTPMAGIYVYADDLNLQVNEDQTIDIKNTNFRYGHNTDFTNNINPLFFDGNSLVNNLGSSSAGFDVGITYEFRPNSRYLKDDAIYRYKLRAGVSWLNIGQLKMDVTDYFSGDNYSDVAINQDVFESVENFDAFLDDQSEQVTKIKELPLTFSLPSNFNLFLDYQLTKGLFVNFNVRTGKSGGQFQIGETARIAMTIRLEGKGAGVFLPISYLEGEPHFGLATRLGPFTFGVSDITGIFNRGVEGERVSGFAGFRVPVSR